MNSNKSLSNDNGRRRRRRLIMIIYKQTEITNERSCPLAFFAYISMSSFDCWNISRNEIHSRISLFHFHFMTPNNLSHFFFFINIWSVYILLFFWCFLISLECIYTEMNVCSEKKHNHMVVKNKFLSKTKIISNYHWNSTTRKKKIITKWHVSWIFIQYMTHMFSIIMN